MSEDKMGDGDTVIIYAPYILSKFSLSRKEDGSLEYNEKN